jgi:diaminopimelate epimerase
MGNPHLVLFVEEDPDGFPVGDVGPQVEHSELFPEHTNVEFVALADGSSARACGNAASERRWRAAPGLRRGRGCQRGGPCSGAGDGSLPRGPLEVERLADGTVDLTGPAEHVFDGALDPTWLTERAGGSAS